MKCAQARKLFGLYWDDDATQAEREWLEAHFVSCSPCRHEYEEFSRALEWVATLPRVEAAPNFAERTLSRARRAASIRDRVPQVSFPWVPVTAAAALLIVFASFVTPWMQPGGRTRVAARETAGSVVRQPELVAPRLTAARDVPSRAESHRSSTSNGAALRSDSLFDHGDDVEFILDPITLRRGRATMTRLPAKTEKGSAVISF
jgi:anti-sigma factor RsiW